VTSVLDVKDLKTEFRMKHSTVVAVDGISFSVNQGECVGVVGESGCGKSTTGLSIMRLLPNNGHVTAGSVTLLGRDLATLDEGEMRDVRGDDVALIPQDPMTSLNPTMTIGRQISEGYRLHRDVNKAQARERALEVLTAERLDQYPHELSGGLRQRVMIAMALVCQPKLLIADEPTTALDVTIQAQILDLIDDLREKLRMGVLLITHDMGVIAGRTDRVVVMYAGKIAEEAATGVLFEKMRHPYAEALLASVPQIDQDPDEMLLSSAGRRSRRWSTWAPAARALTGSPASTRSTTSRRPFRSR
jgi:peptide/nickel transport system ATP-binding protein